MKKKILKVLNVVVDILIIMVLIVSVFTLVTVLTTTNGGEGVPNIFGKAPISVLTDSMKGDGEDNFVEGDLLICDVVDPNAENTFNVGDIVTFRQNINNDENMELVTHRLYKQNEDGSFQTKGDNNDTYDQNPNNTIQFYNIYSSDILAVYHGTKIGGVGKFLDFIRSSQGFFICILLPMILFFIYQAVRVIMNAMAYSKEKGKLAAEEAIRNADLTEEQKARAIAEYLAAQNAQSDDTPKADDSPDTDGTEVSEE